MEFDKVGQKRICELFSGDVYRLPGGVTWTRVVRISDGMMWCEKMQFSGLLTSWKAIKPVSHKAKTIVELKG